MRTVVKGASLAAILLLAVSASAQDNKVKPANAAEEPGVHKMEIYNGPLRTVSYIYSGLSPSEAQAIRELERAENEMTLADEMLKLRMQYVSGERVFDAQRRFSQQQLYGYSSSGSESSAFTVGRRIGPFGALYSHFAPFWGGWGWGMGGYGGYGGSAVAAASASTDTVSLSQGVGDEGALKTDLARTIAIQATPEYAARAQENLAVAQAVVASDPKVRDMLRMPAAVVLVQGGTVTLASGEKITGDVIFEGAEWLVIKTPQGVRKIHRSQVGPAPKAP
ncbi:MAG TPA: hypothetical protein VKD72_11495 [Gemmataceae bacterium]|nr:hypothetical protein [Gemmataceae bacterium]